MFVCGGGAALGAADLVELALDIEGPGPVGVPDPADHVDCLAQGRHALHWGEPPSADCLHGVPEEAGAEPEARSSTGEQVEAGRRAGEHGGGLAQRQVQHVAGQADALGPRGHPAQQSPGVEEVGLVGMILEGDEVETEPLTELRQFDWTVRWGVGGRDERGETQRMTIVRHRCLLQSFVCGRPRPNVVADLGSACPG